MRSFLSIAMIILTALTIGCGKPETNIEPISYERSERIMGTLITLRAEGAEAQAAVDESFNAVFELVDHIKNDMSRLENADAFEYVAVNRDVFEILKISQDYSERTDGAFDVTVGAAIDVWKTARQNETLPSETDLDNARDHVGFQHVHLNDADNSVMIDLKGVKINLGGVAKGYGVDLAREIFANHNIQNGLIDFGTSTIYAVGTKKIGIKNPRGGGLDEIVELRDGAISTSGDYEKFFVIDGKRYHHIIDPKTCAPVDNGIASVTVIVDGTVEHCATVADILSTSIFVLGEERSTELLSQTDYKLVNVSHIDGADGN